MTDSLLVRILEAARALTPAALRRYLAEPRWSAGLDAEGDAEEAADGDVERRAARSAKRKP